MTSETTKQGIEAAIDAVGAGDAPAADEEQLALLPLDRPATAAEDAEVHLPRRGPGRPPGAKNRRTEAWTEYLLATRRSPLEVLADVYTMPVEDLARRLSCKLEDAIKVQIDAAKALAPYLHQKQPLAVNVDSKGVVQLVIVEGESAAEITDPGDGDTIIDVTPERTVNQ